MHQQMVDSAKIKIIYSLGNIFNKLLYITLVYCIISIAWSSTYHMNPYGDKPNHSCVEMTDEVSEVFTALHIPHKKVMGMTSYNEEWSMLECHEWIMIKTPLGEVPFESTSLMPVLLLNDYYSYDVVIEENF